MPRSIVSFSKACWAHGLADNVFARPTWADFQAGIYECLGTTLFISIGLMGCQSYPSMAAEPGGGSPMCGVSMSASFFAVSLISAFFNFTSGFFHPTVSLALFASGHIGFWRFFSFVVGQLIGSIVAPALLEVILAAPQGHSTNVLEDDLIRAAFSTTFCTGVLILAVLRVAFHKRTVTLLERSFARFCVAWAICAGCFSRENRFTRMNPTGPFGVPLAFLSTQRWFWAGPILASLLMTRVCKEIDSFECEIHNGELHHQRGIYGDFNREKDFLNRHYKKPLQDHSGQQATLVKAPSHLYGDQFMVPILGSKAGPSLSPTPSALMTPCSHIRHLVNDQENCLAPEDSNKEFSSLFPWGMILVAVLICLPLLVPVLPACVVVPLL